MSRDVTNSSSESTEPCATSTPCWLQRFANRVGQALHSPELLAPVGCHFHLSEQGDVREWEVTLFVSNTEIYGGARDGQLGVARFLLDLKVVSQIFDEVDSLYWQPQWMAEDDDLGPHVGVEGQFEGHSVWLRFTAAPPARFEQQPGRIVDLLAHSVTERW